MSSAAKAGGTYLTISRPVDNVLRVHFDPRWSDEERLVRVLRATKTLAVLTATLLPQREAFIDAPIAAAARDAAGEVHAAVADLVAALDKFAGAGAAVARRAVSA